MADSFGPGTIVFLNPECTIFVTLCHPVGYTDHERLWHTIEGRWVELSDYHTPRVVLSAVDWMRENHAHKSDPIGFVVVEIRFD